MANENSDLPDAADVCLNCNRSLSGPFCEQCGQEAKPPLRSLLSSLSELIEDFASLDFRAVYTVRRLMLEPGAVTREYTTGHRVRFTPPFRLYIVVSAMSITLMSTMGFFNLEAVLQSMPTEQRVALGAALNLDLESAAIAERFNSRFSLLFPIFNLFTPLGLALALKVALRRRLFHEHAIAGLHLGTAQVLIGSLMFPIGFASPVVANLLAASMTLALIIYTWSFLGRMYGRTSWRRFGLLCVLGFTYGMIVMLLTGFSVVVALGTI